MKRRFYKSTDKLVSQHEIDERIKVEQSLVKAAVHELLKHGFQLSVHTADGDTERTDNEETILNDLMRSNEEYLYVWESDERANSPRRWIHLKYGVDEGWGVIDHYMDDRSYSAHSSNLDETLRPVFALEEE